MQLTAISVCVNYFDFFAWSALANRGLFSKWIIVTDTKDVKTKAIANYYGYQCIQTDIFYEGGSFKKFNGINAGLEKAGKEWILFLDSDIVLPPITKRVFDNLSFNQENLYGIDRINFTNFNQWVNYCNNPNLIVDNWLMTSAGGDLEHESFNSAQKPIRITAVEFSNSSPLAQNRCYLPFFVGNSQI